MEAIVAKDKYAGMAPLGWGPFGKEKLEGNKKTHDYHGMDASVPGKRPIGDEHWERRYNATTPSDNMYLTQGDDFAPKRSDERKTTYIKVNREDH